MERLRISAGIVLYNPDIERLRLNIEAIKPQVDALYFIDNASSNWIEVEPLLQGGIVQRNPENKGIAYALNQLMQMGQKDGMQWVLTLDQDSVASSNLVSTLARNIKDLPHAGILCPVIIDRSFGIEHSPSPNEDVTEVKECITSASLTRVQAWSQSGGFDEKLFIDAVDTDFCLSLKEHGWQVLRINNICLLHEIGHQSTLHTVFRRKYIAFNHVPIRYYYIARNMVYLSRKHEGYLHPAPWRCILTMIARMFVILLWEKDKRFLKCGKIIRGILDGCRM